MSIASGPIAGACVVNDVGRATPPPTIDRRHRLAPPCLRRAAAWLHARTYWMWSGYSRADVTMAVQMALGWAVLLSILSVDKAASALGTLGVQPTLTVVLYGYYVQALQGATLGAAVAAQLVAGLIGALGFIPTYAAYAANGGSYEGAGAAKGATLVAVGAVLAALLVIPRIRLSPMAYQALNVAGFFLSLRLFALYWVEVPGIDGPVADPYPPNKLAYLLMFDVLFPVGAALPITALVLPAPASRKAREALCKVVRGLGELYGGVVDLLLLEDDTEQAAPATAAPPQPPAAADGKGSTNGQSASGAAQAVAKLQDGAAAIRKGIQGMGLLLLVSLLEIDVYAAPRRLRTGAYKRATAHAAAAETCLSLALRWAAATRRPLDRGLCRQLAPQLRAMQAALAGLCEALASAVEQQAGAPSNSIVAALGQLELRRGELNAAAAAMPSTSQAAVSFALMRGGLYYAATKVRAMAPFVAEAVEPQQPGAAAAVAAHFAVSAWLADPPQLVPAAGLDGEQSVLLWQARSACDDPGDDDAAGAGGKSSSQKEPSARGSPGATPAPETSLSLPAAEQLPALTKPAGHLSAAAGRLSAAAPAVVRPSAPVEATPRGALWRHLDRAGVGRVALVPALHMLLAFAAAGALVVCKAAYVGLGYKSYWVAFTVNSVFEKSAGRIRQRAINRLLGTAMAAAWSCATIGVVVGVNGGSWENRPPKFIALVVMSSLWAVFIGLNRQRHARFAYAWSVAMVAMAVIVLEEFRATTSPWIEAGWRLACVCIGVGIEAVITSCIFPVTTADLELDQLMSTLSHLACLGQGVAASQAGCEDGSDSSHSSGSGSSCRKRSSTANLPEVAAAEGNGTLKTGGEDAASEQAGLAGAAAADEAAAAEAGLASLPQPSPTPTPAAAAVAASWPTLPSRQPPTAAQQRQQLQAQAQQVKKHAGRLLALSAGTVEGPLPPRRTIRQRHQAMAAAVHAVLHIADSLLLATYSEELREDRLAARAAAGSIDCGGAPAGTTPAGCAAGLPPARRRLALAVGAQFAECVHCLRLVLARQLPFAQALPALRALDSLLHQLADAAGLELQALLQQAAAATPVQLPDGADSEASKLVVPVLPVGSAATLLPLAAAMLSAVPQLRMLFLHAVQAVLPDGAAAAQAVRELGEEATASWRAIADAQHAALAASLQARAG